MGIMKNYILILILLFPTFGNASGIPVVDVAAFSQMLVDGATRAAEFAEEIAAFEAQLSEMEAQADYYKDMVDGHYDYETILNDPTNSPALNKWKMSASDLNGLRGEFNLNSSQKEYDKTLEQYHNNKKFHSMTVARNGRLSSLLSQFSGATTPAQKSDIGNALLLEQVQAQNDALMISTYNESDENARIVDAGIRATNDVNTIFGSGYEQTINISN